MYTPVKNKFFAALCALSLFSMSAFADLRTHEVQPGETLYKLSKLYNVSEAAIQAANPGVIEGTRVPAGAIINIPDPVETQAQVADEKISDERLEIRDERLEKVEKVDKAESKPVTGWFHRLFGESDSVESKAYTVAVIQPFNLESKSDAEDKTQMRSVEFYQGALVAVNEAQQQGMHIRLLTYDLGTEPIEQILEHAELKEADVIIGPTEPADIRQVAIFGESHDINVINPFKIVPELTDKCSRLFQLNTPMSQLYPELCSEVKERFSEYNFVFISDSLFVQKRDPFADNLMNSLKASGVKCYEYIYGSPESVAAMDDSLGLKYQNILYVPVTNQKDALRRFFPSLKNKIFMEQHPELAIAVAEEDDPELAERLKKEYQEYQKMLADSIIKERKTAVLGYPDWQLHTHDFMEHFYDMNVWMFSKFYVDPFDPKVEKMYAAFRYWYAREMLDLFPKYGMLGYDVMSYALQMLGNYGRNFQEEADGKYIETLQNAMLFRKEGEGGFLNRGLYLVHFTPDATIEKYEIK